MGLGQASSSPLALIADFALGGSQETVGCMAKKEGDSSGGGTGTGPESSTPEGEFILPAVLEASFQSVSVSSLGSYNGDVPLLGPQGICPWD